MGYSEGRTEVADFVVDNLPGRNVDADNAELLQLDDVSEDLAHKRRPQVLLVFQAEILDDSPDGRGPTILTQKARAHIVGSGILNVTVELEFKVAEPSHHGVLVLLI